MLQKRLNLRCERFRRQPTRVASRVLTLCCAAIEALRVRPLRLSNGADMTTGARRRWLRNLFRGERKGSCTDQSFCRRAEAGRCYGERQGRWGEGGATLPLILFGTGGGDRSQ